MQDDNSHTSLCLDSGVPALAAPADGADCTSSRETCHHLFRVGGRGLRSNTRRTRRRRERNDLQRRVRAPRSRQEKSRSTPHIARRRNGKPRGHKHGSSKHDGRKPRDARILSEEERHARYAARAFGRRCCGGEHGT